MIVSFRDGVHPDGIAAFVAVRLAERGTPADRWPRGDEINEGAGVILARVDYGRWLADCLFCTNANHVDLEDPRYFCLNCHNERAGFQWLRVVVPSFRLDIEEALNDGRPAAMWSPGQTLEDLQASAPVATVAPSPEQMLATAEAAWQARDGLIEHTERLNARIAELEQAVAAERRGAMAVIHVAEARRMMLEAERAAHEALAASTQAPHAHEHN